MKIAVAIIAAWLFMMLQGWLFRRFWDSGLTARLSFVQRAAVEGNTGQLKEIITNRKFLPLPVLHVKFQMGRYLVFSASNNFKITDQNYRSDIFSCMPWQEIRRTLDFTCKKRGYYHIGSIDLVSYDLFFFGHCVATVPEDTYMYVYPGPADPIRLELPLKNLMGQILARQALLKDPFETQSVRPYQSYDPYKTVNWKATAHTGELKVNVYTPASSWNVTILLDMESERLWTDEDLTEEAIRLCGSMSKWMIDRGIPVAVWSNGCDCLTGLPSRLDAGAGKEHLRSIMELLARVQLSTGTAGAHGTRNADPTSALDALYASKQASSGISLNTGAKIAGEDRHVTMEELLSHMIDERSSSFSTDSTLYVMISPGQRKSLAEHFDALCRQSIGSQWILPRRPDNELRIAPLHFAQLYDWEVPYGHSYS